MRILGDQLGKAQMMSLTHRQIKLRGWIQAVYAAGEMNGACIQGEKFDDITATRMQAGLRRPDSGHGKSPAVIEFNMDGTISPSEWQFPNTMGYEQTKGREHHSKLLKPSTKQVMIRRFGALNARNTTQSTRFGKGGKIVLESSLGNNPYSGLTVNLLKG